MAINIGVPTEDFELKPRITVIGTGGAGGNAVNNMIRSNLEGVEFVVANTDAQALAQSLCPNHIQLGTGITRGLGAGSRPEIGRAAAEEALDDIMEYLHGSNMVFVTAGMGGGTGTGAAPVIASAAREMGILTVGVVTKPFHFEGAHRMRLAEQGLEDLQKVVDTLIIIPNQNLFRLANEKTTFADAFKMADDVLHSGVRGITDLMVMPGLINLDFADIRTVMMEMGKAMMGTGEAEGEGRAVAAAEAAISNPLLDDVSMRGARGVLINITGGLDMTLFEIDEAANRIREEVDADANIIFGSTFDEKMAGTLRLSIVATGIDGEALKRAQPAEQPQQASPYNYHSQPVKRSAYQNPFGAPVRQALRQPQQPQQNQPVQPSIPQQPQQQGHSLPPQQAEVAISEPAPAAVYEENRRAAPQQQQQQKPVFVPPQASEAPFLDSDVAQSEVEAEQVSRSVKNKPSFLNRITGGSGKGSTESSGNGDVYTNAARQKQEDDDLDIPAFLRRQAN